MMTIQEKNELLKQAVKVREHSYSPYSKYKVGAALLADSGKIYVGSNFENAAFGAGVCAERVALGAALSSGERKFKAICVCGDSTDITPCGICRQALAEFNDIEVICCDVKGNTSEYKLSDMLPMSFGKKHLGEK